MSEEATDIQSASAAVVAGHAALGQLKTTSSEGAAGDGNGTQDNTPGDGQAPVSDDDTGAQAPDEESTDQVLAEIPPGSEVSAFDSAYGHLEGDALETAKQVFVAQEQQKADSDAVQARGYTGD